MIMKPSDPWNPDYPEEYEELFEEAFDKATQTSSLYSMADKQKSWQTVQQRIKLEKRRRKRHQRFRLAILAATSMIIGGMLFSQPLLTQAVSPIYQKMTNWGDGMNKLVFGSNNSQGDESKAKTSPPPEAEMEESPPKAELIASGSYTPVSVSLDEAREVLPFDLPEITYIPDRFSLETVELMDPPNQEQADSLYIRYFSLEDEQLRMLFNLIHENETITSMTDEHTETITLDNDTIAYYEAGRFSSLTFTIGNVLVKVFGDVDKEELLQIANNFE